MLSHQLAFGTSPYASSFSATGEQPLNDHNIPAIPGRPITVLTLAVELNTSTRTLLALAREMHLPIFDDEDQLTDDDVDRLRTLYSMTGGRMPSHQLTEVIPGFTPGTFVREHDPEITAIENFLGIHKYRRRGRGTGPRREPSAPPRYESSPEQRQPSMQGQRGPRPALSGAAAAAARHWPYLSDTVAKAVAANWKHHGFTEGETVAWWDAEVEYSSPQIARELVGYGVTPQHLQLVIRKETVGARLREGRLSPRQIAELLNREGHLPNAS